MKLKDRIKRFLPASWRYRIELEGCRTLIQAIEKARPHQDDDGGMHGFYCEITDAYQWRRTLINDNYRRLTEALSVPMPDFRDSSLWEPVENGMTQQSVNCLTTAGEHAAIAVIREAQKHRRDVYSFWLTGLTGIGGVIIGIVSILAK